MANKVFRLSEEAVHLIAAGEVIERPASVIKELLENSLDAGATRIRLDIMDGGRTLIRVADNGSGMSSSDAALALERHTTSKIRTSADLEKLSTFGFRGEALPSIASVSKIILSSRLVESQTAVEIKAEGGVHQEQKETGRAEGTTIEVRDLFFNVPARLKFLKSEGTEKNKILRTFEEIAAAHPSVALELRSGGKMVLELPSRTDGISRIQDLWGETFGPQSLIPLDFSHPNLKILGWVSSPSSHRPTRNYQIFYVNKRPIHSRTLSHALYEAYRDCLPVSRHPTAVLFFELDASQVDVNVHPAKREVRFRSEGQIYECLVREIRLKRSRLSETPKVLENLFNESIPRTSPVETPEPSFADTGTSVAVAFRNQTQVLSQFEALYILSQKDGNLVIVDQHAASERVLYERLKSEMKSQGTVSTQPLLIPFLWNVQVAQAGLLIIKLSALQKLGFLLYEFGDRTFRVTEIPTGLPETDLQLVLDEILRSIEDERDPEALVESILIRTACKSAVKANERLSNPELDRILNELSQCQNPHTCPHGRPTTLTISRAELDKKFGRNY